MLKRRLSKQHRLTNHSVNHLQQQQQQILLPASEIATVKATTKPTTGTTTNITTTTVPSTTTTTTAAQNRSNYYYYNDDTTSSSSLSLLNRRVYPQGCLKTTTTATTERIDGGRDGGTAVVAVWHQLNTNTIKSSRGSSSIHNTTAINSSFIPFPVSRQSQLQQQHPPLILPVVVMLKKTVSFQEVYIREYERILGDNPSCSSGAPISLGWNHAMDTSVPVDVYEERKSKSLRRRNNTDDDYTTDSGFILTRHDRETLLMEWGVTFNEMIDAIRNNVKIKNQRRRTVHAIGTYDRIEEMMETTAHKLKSKLKINNNIKGGGTHVLVKTADTTTTSSQQQQPRTLFHGNHVRRSYGTGRNRHNTNHNNHSQNQNHIVDNEYHSIRSASSDNVSNCSSSLVGSGVNSNSTTTNSTSNAAVCCNDKSTNNKKKKNDHCAAGTKNTSGNHDSNNDKHHHQQYQHHDETQEQSINDSTSSEVNDFSTNIRTPGSSTADMDVVIVDAVGDCGKCCDGNNVTTVTATTNNLNDSNENCSDVQRTTRGCCTTTTPYDLDDEVEKALIELATKNNNNNKKKKHSWNRSKSVGDQYQQQQGSNNHRNKDDKKNNYHKSNRVTVPIIIGVDIPRDVELQRTISVESGLTYDPYQLQNSSSHNSTKNNEKSRNTQQGDDDNGGDDVDFECYHHCNNNKNNNMQNDASLSAASDCDNDNDQTHEGNDDNDVDDDLTMPSKFLKEFSELMIGDTHPSILNKSISRSHDCDDDDIRHDEVKRTDSQLSVTQAQQHQHSVPIEMVDQHRKNPNGTPSTFRKETNNDAMDVHKVGGSAYDDECINYCSASKSMDEEDYHEIVVQHDDHPLSPISEFTGGGRFHNSFSTKTSSASSNPKAHPDDGNFDILQRDSTFWEICPGEHDSPQIQRREMPVVITEDVSVGESAMNIFEKPPTLLFRITEDPQQYHVNGHDTGYNNDMYANGLQFPTLMDPNHTMSNSFPETHHQQLPGSVSMQSRYPLLAAISLPTSNHPPASFIQQQQQQQRDPVTNNNILYPFAPKTAGGYQHPPPLPPLVVVASSIVYPPQPTTMDTAVLDTTGQSSYIPPELLYNIENGQRQYNNNIAYAPHNDRHPYEAQQPPFNNHQPQQQQQHHHLNYHHNPSKSVYSHCNTFDSTDNPNTAVNEPTTTTNTQTQAKWDDYGFRMEPPPNSTTMLIHKIMM